MDRARRHRAAFWLLYISNLFSDLSNLGPGRQKAQGSFTYSTESSKSQVRGFSGGISMIFRRRFAFCQFRDSSIFVRFGIFLSLLISVHFSFSESPGFCAFFDFCEAFLDFCEFSRFL